MKVINQSEFGSVSIDAISADVDVVEIVHQRCEAKVSLYGGQVMSWQPDEYDEVFWLSESAEYKQGKAIRGGIPLCWPWFGGYKDAGNHGFARTVVWTLEETAITDLGVEIVLSWQGENMHPLWPTNARLVQKLFFGDVFEQTLIMKNLTDSDAQYTGALHSYFAVSHPQNTHIDALKIVPFDCKLSGDTQITDSKENMVGPMDRIYYSSDSMDIVDTGANRIVKVSAKNTNQWVLWNPGQQTAQAMSDVHQHGENEFVCLEAANTQWQPLPARQVVAMSQKVELIRL